jgi:hypothetical protein
LRDNRTCEYWLEVTDIVWDHLVSYLIYIKCMY